MSTLIIDIHPEFREPVTLHEKLVENNIDSFLLSVYPYPFPFDFCLDGTSSGDSRLINPSTGQTVAINSIRSVFNPCTLDLFPISIFQHLQRDAQEIAYEVKSALGSLLFSINEQCKWFDHIQTHNYQLYKPLQIPIVAQLGIPVPETIITSHPESIRNFYKNHPQNTIMKPCTTFAYARLLTEQDMTPESLHELCQTPVTVQEYIEGADILVFMVEDRIFPVEIELINTVDYRQSQSALYTPVTLPESVIQQCHQIRKVFQANFVALDFKKAKDGRYLFLEINPAPAFLHFENASGYPITDTLVEALSR